MADALAARDQPKGSQDTSGGPNESWRNLSLPVEVASVLLATSFDPADDRPVIVGWRAVRALSARRDPITPCARLVIEHSKTGTIYETDIDVDIERFGYEQAWGRETDQVVFYPANPDA